MIAFKPHHNPGPNCAAKVSSSIGMLEDLGHCPHVADSEKVGEGEDQHSHISMTGEGLAFPVVPTENLYLCPGSRSFFGVH